MNMSKRESINQLKNLLRHTKNTYGKQLSNPEEAELYDEFARDISALETAIELLDQTDYSIFGNFGEHLPIIFAGEQINHSYWRKLRQFIFDNDKEVDYKLDPECFRTQIGFKDIHVEGIASMGSNYKLQLVASFEYSKYSARYLHSETVTRAHGPLFYSQEFLILSPYMADWILNQLRATAPEELQNDIIKPLQKIWEEIYIPMLEGR